MMRTLACGNPTPVTRRLRTPAGRIDNGNARTKAKVLRQQTQRAAHAPASELAHCTVM
jgi:hypothetical protein